MDESRHGDELGPAKAKEAGLLEAKVESAERGAAADATPAETPQAPHPTSQERQMRQDECAAHPADQPQVGEHGAAEAASGAPIPTEAREGSSGPTDAADEADDKDTGAVETSPEASPANYDREPAPARPSAEPLEPVEAVIEDLHVGKSIIDVGPGLLASPDANEDLAINAAQDAGHHVQTKEADAGGSPSESSGRPVVTEYAATGEVAAGTAEREDTSEVPSEEPIAPDPEPSPSASAAPEIPLDEPVEVISELITGEAAVEVEHEPLARPEPNLASDAAGPAETRPDPPPAPSSALVEALPSQTHRSVSRDTFTVQPGEPRSNTSGAGTDAPSDELNEPIREEQIWSGPEVIDPGARGPELESIDPYRPASEVDSRAETTAHVRQHSPKTALLETAQPLAQSAGARRPLLNADWPSVSLPSPDTGGAVRYYLHVAARIATAMVVIYVTAVLLLVVLYRWVDPPTSTLMLGQRLAGVEIAQRWVPLQRMSPHLIHAVILSEDGGFCRHRGVDWSALGEAIEDSRGGSTITMQVVKNLFLWPARSYVRKALEIVLAYVVEIVWPKQRVLEIYLNIAEWGPGVFGAEAAARQHFGKAASRLNAQEAALLAVTLPSPIERQAGRPGWQTRRLANNLLIRMRAVRSPFRCVRGGLD